jgi:hypothetical protein
MLFCWSTAAFHMHVDMVFSHAMDDGSRIMAAVSLLMIQIARIAILHALLTLAD